VRNKETRRRAQAEVPVLLETIEMGRSTQAKVVLVTCGSLPEARKIAKAVIAKQLAGCVNVISAPVESIYRWKGKVEHAREFLLVIKTTPKRRKELETEIARLHSYEVPEFLVLDVAGGSKKYLEWLAGSV
jgi:periplasmic divalent cation tolerance protein